MRLLRAPTKNIKRAPQTSSRRGVTFHNPQLWKVTATFCVLAAVFLWWNLLQKPDPARFATAPLQELEKVAQRPDANQGFAAYQLGRRYQNLGVSDKSEAAFERAALQQVDYAPAWLSWALARERAGRQRDALQILQTYLQNHPDDGEAHLALGWFYRRARAYKEAYAEAESAARLMPSSPKPWLLLGETAALAADGPRAENAFRKALALQPDRWQTQAALGDVLVNLDREKEALPFLERAVQLAPQEAQALYALGRTLLKTATSASQIEQARRHLQHSARLRPDVPRTHLLLGQSYMRQSKWKEALQQFQQLERLPHDAEIGTARAYESSVAWSRLGDETRAARERVTHRKLVEYRSVKDIIAKQIVEKPTDLAPRLRLARLCATFDEFSFSIGAYQKLLAYAPQALAEKQSGVEEKVRLASRELSQVRQRAARAQLQAQAVLESAAGKNGLTESAETRDTDSASADTDFSDSQAVPLSLQATLRDADYLFGQKRWSEAQRAYLSAAKTDDKSGLAFQGAGLTMMEGDDKAQGINFLRRALSLDAKLSQANYVIGSLCLEAGLRTGAVRYLEMATRAAPDNAEYWHQLSAAYASEDEQLKEAEGAARRAAALEPKNLGYQLDWGQAQEAIDKWDDAERTYRKALSEAPQDLTGLVRLGSFLVNRRSDAARLREGEALLQKALKSNPKDGYALFSLGRFYLQQEQLPNAVRFLQNAVKVSPDVPEIWYSLSQARRLSGDSAGADKAIKISRKLFENYLAVGRAQEQVAQTPRNFSRRHNLARRYAAAGRHAQAIQQFEIAVKLQPQDQALRRELEMYQNRLANSGQTPSMDVFYALLAAADSVRRG